MKKTLKDVVRACALCEYATPAPNDADGNEVVMCSKRGLVKAGGKCGRFKYDILKRDPKRQQDLPEIEKIDI